MPNVDSIWIKTNKLLTYHYGCHSNIVTIATRYVPDACQRFIPNMTSIGLKTKKSYLHNTVVAMVTKLP